MDNNLDVILFNVKSPYKELNELNFKRIDFEKAVQITQKIELLAREEKENFASEFVITSNEKDLYKGIFNFGSGNYTNLYHQIKDKVPKIKVKKELQNDKNELLKQIEYIDGEYKKIIENSITINPSHVSKLNQWKRKVVYSLLGVTVISSLFMGYLYTTKTSAYEKALIEGKNELKDSENLNQLYETALLNTNKKSLYDTLSSKKELNENQKKLVAINFLEKSKYSELMQLFEEDSLKVNNFILSTTLKNKEKITKDFNEFAPSNEGKFAVAYYDKNYDLLLNIKNVTMNVTRSEMKTYAYLKTNQIELAKSELNNNNNKAIGEKIIKYEGLTAEIDTLKNKAKTLEKNKKKKKERTEILKQIKDKIAEREEL